MSLVGGLLLVRLRRMGIDLSEDGGRLLCTVPPGVMTADLKATIATYKMEILELLTAEPEVSRLHREIEGLWGAMGAAIAAGNYRSYEELDRRRAELANGPVLEALERLIALAGDSWVELLESRRPPRPVQSELVGVR